MYSVFEKELNNNNKYKNMTFFNKKTIIKKGVLKKIVYTVIDGIIRYDVTLYPNLECQCGIKNCNHVKYLLRTLIYLIDIPITFLFLNKVTDYIKLQFEINYNNIKDVNFCKKINYELQEIIYNHFSEIECLCCLEKLNHKKYYPHLFVCNICNNICHVKCLEQWLNHGKHIKKGCFHCRSSVNNNIIY